MDLWRVGRTLRRRWYLTALGVGLTVIVAAVTLASTPPVYEAKSVIVLLGPSRPPADTPTVDTGKPLVAGAVNPYRTFDGSITTTAQVMSEVMKQPEVVAALRRQGASGDFAVDSDATGGPTVTISGRASSAGKALHTSRLVVAEFRIELAHRQAAAGAPDNTLISASDVVVPHGATLLTKTRNRALAAIVTLGLAATVGLVVIADSLVEGRRGRRMSNDTAGRRRPVIGPPAARRGSADPRRPIRTTRPAPAETRRVTAPPAPAIGPPAPASDPVLTGSNHSDHSEPDAP
ncbi:MAG TPA: hypothetical protein VHA73_15960 [Acidimicrobiales bacterium]|nr:hypothetical protein [Acidimicrobiales bacterium]